MRAGTEQGTMAEFSLDLNEDQLQIQKWVHDFAENVIRPAGHEWDEREETPWPIIEEAARIGLYSFDFILQCFTDESGLLLPIANEEMSWGDAGISLAVFGSTLGLAGIASNGTPEQIAEWGPQCFGTPDKIQMAAFAVSEPDAGSDVSSLRTRAVYDQAKDEWVINGSRRGSPTAGSPTFMWWWPRSIPSSAPEARPASSFRRTPRVWPRGRSSRRWASALRTPPR